jgi:hypothetical protein
MSATTVELFFRDTFAKSITEFLFGQFLDSNSDSFPPHAKYCSEQPYPTPDLGNLKARPERHGFSESPAVVPQA